ncbi:MAG TPA: nuclear transport factor 2 family protein [Steroidobacteraceae bacterium]|nr:nuclear transport factor 2 family protein [Steroidobacteraceae bacterium]
MRLSRWSWMMCALLIAVQARAGQEVGDYRGLPADLAAAATAYDLAQIRSDRSELERLLADDYTLAGSDGKNETKAQDIADSVAPGRKTTYVAISKQVRKVWPNGAVLGGIVDAKGVDHGRPFVMRARFVDVWAERNGRWQVIFTQIHDVSAGRTP